MSDVLEGLGMETTGGFATHVFDPKAERLQLKYNTVCRIHLELTEVKIDVDLGPGLSRR